MAAEPPAPYLLLLPLIAIPLIFFLALSSRRRRNNAHHHRHHHQPRLPPGPRALPIIGHLHHLLAGARAATPPHRTLRDLARRHGPDLMLLRLCDLPVVVASSPAAAREILRTHDASFASRHVGPTLRRVFRGSGSGGGGEGLIFAPYGDAWRQLRKICTLELFTARRVRSSRLVRADEVARLLRAVASSAAAGSPAVNLSERITAFAADAAVRAMIGGRSERRDEFLRLLLEALEVIPGMSLPDLFPSSRLALRISAVPGKIQRRRKRLFDIVDQIILEHQEKKRAASGGGEEEDEEEEEEDLLDVLLRLQKDMDYQYPLTTDNLKSVLIDLFGAGSETTATTLKWAMAELMRNPTSMRKAQDEVRRALTVAGHDTVTEDTLTNLPYLHLVIKETLRLHPPAPLLLPRECRTSPGQRVLGYDVPRGAMVLVNAWAIGRDPAVWAMPEEFAPERFEEGGGMIGRDFRGGDFELIPFGAGRRMCPGMAFGLAHVELALAALLFHFDWELPDGTVAGAEEMDMAEAVAITAPPRSDLVLRPVTRVPVLMD